MCPFQISGLTGLGGVDNNRDLDLESGDLNDGFARRESHDLAVTASGEGGDQVLGTMHCTMKYSFDKNALIVTVNKCVNLPPKDIAAKSRCL